MVIGYFISISTYQSLLRTLKFRDVYRVYKHWQQTLWNKKESVRDYTLSILTWPFPSSWSLENTMRPSENSILERASPLMSPRFPSPSLYETSVAAAPLCSCQQGRVCVCVCVCTNWGGVGCEVSVGRVITPPPLEGSNPHTCGTSHLSMANSH